ncbi:MAG: GNAT family N-acetyltransferase [Candidatus Staskawiczbacteria bacterium]|nr:GNAT family N-acetyltransferase [Candidatus Staskawiczbacteria bacterium]
MEKEKHEAPGEISLRGATEDDIDSILEVEKDLVGTKIYSGLADAKDAKQEMEENIYYLIEKDGKVVGDTSYQMKNKDYAYISGLAVAKEFQGQGIAKQAMITLLEKLKNIKLVDLVTHPENEKAIKLYESLGFKKTGEQIEDFYGDGEPRIRMVLQK